jgi:hypothetical protein
MDGTPVTILQARRPFLTAFRGDGQSHLYATGQDARGSRDSDME